jgi:hypothetical protein
LRPYINGFAVCYLEDILIYSTTEKEHEEDVRKVLQRLQEFCLYGKAEKFQFGVLEVGFLRFIVNLEVISMERDRISTIEAWLTPKSVREMQVFLGITNLYRRFMQK